MLDLKLFCKLKATDTVTMILKNNGGGNLDYFIVSQSVAFSLITYGKAEGVVKDTTQFNIRLGVLLPLIEKGYKFFIKVVDNQLHFESETGDLVFSPLCVEFYDEFAANVVKKYLRYEETVQRGITVNIEKTILEQKIASLKEQYNSLTIMQLSSTPNDPFTPDTKAEEARVKYQEDLKTLEDELAKVDANSNDTTVGEYDFSDFIPLSLIAARAGAMLHMCEDYSVVDLKDVSFFRKGDCISQVFNGKLLYQLLLDGNGKHFYTFENDIVYTSEKGNTSVFIPRYLPSTCSDPSMLTRGVVQEKYSVNLRTVIALLSVIKSHFSDFKINFGEGKFILSNDSGERLIQSFDISDAKTLQLSKMMRDGSITGDISMATVTLPKEMQTYLSMFKENTVFYVKSKKIVIQSDRLYAVFGRIGGNS